MEETKKVCR